MARLRAEFRNGRVLPAKIVQVGPHRAFAVQLTGVRPGRPENAAGRLVGYDSAGRVQATWKI